MIPVQHHEEEPGTAHARSGHGSDLQGGRRIQPLRNGGVEDDF